MSIYAAAQEGTPSAKIFSNFNYDMSADEGENAFKEFEIKRAYLGYSHKIDERFSTKIIFDVGSNSAGSEYTAFLKIASLKWEACDNLVLNLGMVGTKNFKFMEKAWGRRYIEKSAQDKYKWASAADAGVTADYKISDNISLDAQILNGEGYKKTQSSNGLFRGGLGLTYTVSESLKLRLHQDIMPRAIYDDMNASQTITTAAIAYSTGNMTIGAEIDKMENIDNVTDTEQEMISFYGDYKISDKYTIFARHDDADETNNAGSCTIYGIEREMTKGVTIALNMQSCTDAAEGSEVEETLFLNIEYKF
jgi:hypothetical protein